MRAIGSFGCELQSVKEWVCGPCARVAIGQTPEAHEEISFDIYMYMKCQNERPLYANQTNSSKGKLETVNGPIWRKHAWLLVGDRERDCWSQFGCTLWRTVRWLDDENNTIPIVGHLM